MSTHVEQHVDLIIGTCCRRNKGKARYISVLSAGAQSWRRTEQARWREFAANIDGTTTRPSSTVVVHIDIEKRRKRVSTEDQ